MATRTYCDMCGNTVRSPAKYCFGPAPTYHYSQQLVSYPGVQTQGGLSVLGGGQPGYATNVTTSPSMATVEVDLCPTCEKIWMKRVEAITKTSEVPDVLPK